MARAASASAIAGSAKSPPFVPFPPPAKWQRANLTRRFQVGRLSGWHRLRGCSGGLHRHARKHPGDQLQGGG
eukprot:4481658-Prymnesium_polylepis.2